MKSQNKRYVFITYEDLKKIKFKKLERVCSRVYVLIDAVEENIPFSLIQQTQNFGKKLKWISVTDSPEEDLTYHTTFLMGKLHEKVSKDIEFAILSNDSSFDGLVNFINREGRNCIRVKRKKSKIEKEISQSINSINEEIVQDVEVEDIEVGITQEVEEQPMEASVPTFSSLEKSFMETPVDTDTDKNLIEQTARETVKRLIRSGNRPSDVSLLKSYILLHNQELTIQGNIDNIIHRLEETKEIDIQNQEVIYNF